MFTLPKLFSLFVFTIIFSSQTWAINCENKIGDILLVNGNATFRGKVIVNSESTKVILNSDFQLIYADIFEKVFFRSEESTGYWDFNYVLSFSPLVSQNQLYFSSYKDLQEKLKGLNYSKVDYYLSLSLEDKEGQFFNYKVPLKHLSQEGCKDVKLETSINLNSDEEGPYN
jgi:hypothetical protein